MSDNPPTEKTDAAPRAAQVVQEIARQFREECERVKAERRAMDDRLIAELEKLNVRRSELDVRIARRLADVDAHIERLMAQVHALADDRPPGETRFTPRRPQ